MTLFPNLAVYGAGGSASKNYHTELGKSREVSPSNHLSQNENKLVYTALHQAILSCRIQQVYLLLVKCNAQINSKDLFGRTPLMLCCLVDDIPKAERMMALFLKSGANQKIKDNLGRTALAYACIQGRETLARYLFNDCTDFSIPDTDGNTPLHHNAIQGNHLITQPLVKYYIQYCSDIDQKNVLGYSPLLLACRYGNLCSAAILLHEGEAITNQTENEFFLTPLQWLLKSENHRIRVNRRRHLSIATAPATRRPIVPPKRLDRSETSLSAFYKEFVSPQNTERSFVGEFANSQQFSSITATTWDGVSQPRDDYSMNKSWNESVQQVKRNKTASSVTTARTSAKQFSISDTTDVDWGSMTTTQLFNCIKSYLEKPSQSRVSTANNPVTRRTTFRDQSTSRYLRPDTGELVQVANPRRSLMRNSATTCLRQILEIYSDSFNVLKAAVPPPPKLADPSTVSIMGKMTDDSTNDMSISAISAAKRMSMAKRMSVLGSQNVGLKKK